MSSPPSRCDAARCRALEAAAIAAGAVAAGFADCRAGVDAVERERFSGWLAAGCHGSMEYMVRNEGARRDPGLVLEGARSMLCCAFSYAPADSADRAALVADYARGTDYHRVLRQRLEPVAAAMREAVADSETRICTDSAPVAERYWAEQAGIGRCGLHGQLIVPGAGSKVFLAEILWTASAECGSGQAPALCTGCGRCVRACPGGALDGRGGVDARRCLSYLTTECRGALPEGAPLGKRLCGCDICQDVCPLNATALPPLPEFRASEGVATLTAGEALYMGSGEFRRRLGGSAVSRLGAAQLRRNAEILAKRLKPK